MNLKNQILNQVSRTITARSTSYPKMYQVVMHFELNLFYQKVSIIMVLNSINQYGEEIFDIMTINF